MVPVVDHPLTDNSYDISSLHSSGRWSTVVGTFPEAERGHQGRRGKREILSGWSAIAGKFGCFARVLETTRTEVEVRPSA